MMTGSGIGATVALLELRAAGTRSQAPDVQDNRYQPITVALERRAGSGSPDDQGRLRLVVRPRMDSMENRGRTLGSIANSPRATVWMAATSALPAALFRR
jgi:hypothetical protein